jgi:hypothetical protein
MSATEDFVRWCKQELTRLRTSLKMFESGRISLLHQPQQGPAVDMDRLEIERLKRSILELEALLGRFESER